MKPDGTIKIELRAQDRSLRINGREIDPARSQAVKNHSPDGFNWGYSGSGPAQLALAILLETTDQDRAKRYYQRFKFEWIAMLAQNRDQVLELDMAHWIQEQDERP